MAAESKVSYQGSGEVGGWVGNVGPSKPLWALDLDTERNEEPLEGTQHRGM